jgi:hypothetical protein
MHLCARCNARVNGVKTTESDQEELQNISSTSNPIISNQSLWTLTTFLDSVCELCFGICQLNDSPSFMKHVANCIHDGGHEDVKQFAIFLSLSPSFHIWERYQCLQRHMSYSQWKEMQHIKEIIRLSWKVALKKQFGWTYSSQVRELLTIKKRHRFGIIISKTLYVIRPNIKYM